MCHPSCWCPEMKLWFYYVALALKLLNIFNITLQTSSSKIGTIQHMCRLWTFMLNFFDPECLTAVPGNVVKNCDHCDIELEVDNKLLEIGTATYLLLEEEDDNHLDGVLVKRQRSLLTCENSTGKNYKMLDKFPFHDANIRDLAILNPTSLSHPHMPPVSWGASCVAPLLMIWMRFRMNSMIPWFQSLAWKSATRGWHCQLFCSRQLLGSWR